MDRFKESVNVLVLLNQFRNGLLDISILIQSVCSYFDKIKEEHLSEPDLKFLKFLSNEIGLPHYYDLLRKFNLEMGDINSYDLQTFSTMIYESTLHTSENIKIHRFQKEIIDLYEPGRLNRYFLSASTSFGKTFIVYEIIKKMSYDNVVLIFPTIALLSENLEKLVSDPNYSDLKATYSIHTLSEISEFGEKNIFIYTPERFLSFIEKNVRPLSFNFAFVDEVYKIDNEYLIEDMTRENERDVAYRIAVHYSLAVNTDVLFAGPYIEFNENQSNNSFLEFRSNNSISLLDYNHIETVNKEFLQIKSGKTLKVDEKLIIEFPNTQKTQRLLTLLHQLTKRGENCIVYCHTKSSTERYSKKIINSDINSDWDYDEYSDFIQHIRSNFHKDWVLIDALTKGIGIHHGLIPKYIQKEIIELFNNGKLSVLLSTTTITEGVNTSAKNIIVLNNKKGRKELKKFDAKNISGRAGRFLHHFSGRVFVLQNEFMKSILSEGESIRHKNYDLNSEKNEIDLFYTKDQYLIEADKKRKIDIEKEQEERQIPDDIIKRFKVVSRKDKIFIYDSIMKLSSLDRAKIRKFISMINSSFIIDYEGLQVILDVIEPIVKNENLKFLILHKKATRISPIEYSVFINLLHFYLKDGFAGSMKYKIENDMDVDQAIRETANFIYNTLKYQAVKYLGVFNLMYKFIKSKEEGLDIEVVSGIDILLIKLEYNAITEKGRLASDYGVPQKVLEYYENPTSYANEIKNTFDNYDKKIFLKIEKIINDSI